MSKASIRRSKQLSWLLRHGADEAGLPMDEAGWAAIEDVLTTLGLTDEQLRDAVARNDKGRLQLDGSRIRACQGHSLDGMPVTRDALERSWTIVSPASSLWHGTTMAAVGSIAENGIHPRGRTHVHLAPTATSRVGKRASVEVLLEIDPHRLVDLGVTIFEAPNRVILVRHVPPAAIVDVRPGHAEAISGGPNGNLSLAQADIDDRELRACDEPAVPHARAAHRDETAPDG